LRTDTQAASSTLNTGITNLRTDVQTVSSTLDGSITNLRTDTQTASATLFEGISGLDVRVDEIETNYLDKRVGGVVDATVTINNDLIVGGNFEVGSGTSTLYVGSSSVGINTETPSEALEVSGNGKFTGTIEIAEPTINSHAATKYYVDYAISVLDGGSF
jgi:hypothetical protein